jgi:ribonuclease BN (tRNA processing enzyme)
MTKYSNSITFLGTAGARFVMIQQTRHSGGLWFSYQGTNVLIDPGPGSLIRCLERKPRLEPGILDGIILTHRHLDHCNDINVMIEAMTEGGFVKRGTVFCPADACAPGDSVIFRYVQQYPQQMVIIEPLHKYRIGALEFHVSPPHQHPSQTYGMKFLCGSVSVGLLVDTAYFYELAAFYAGVDTLIVGVVLPEPRPDIYHLSIPEVCTLVSQIKPKKVVLTHFGKKLLALNPRRVAQKMTRELGVPVVAASDGLVIKI